MGFVRKNKKKSTKKLSPIDEVNEQYLIGHALNDHNYAEMLQDVSHEAFLFLIHQAICETIQIVLKEGLEFTIDTIHMLRKRVENGNKVKLDYLGDLRDTFKDETTNPETYTFHVRKLREDKTRDTLSLEMLPELIKTVTNPRNSLEEILEKYNEVRDYIENDQLSGDFRFSDTEQVNVEHDEILKEREEGGIFGTTGYMRLDDVLTDGFAAKKCTVVAGRPAMGKSALVANAFLRIALRGIPVAIYNFEMDRISMYDRMVAIIGQIPLVKIIKHRNLLTNEEREKEKYAKKLLSVIPIYFYNFSTQTIAGIKRELRILKERHCVQLVAYDLFKKVRFDRRAGKSTADVLNESLDEIQAFGKDLGIHQVFVVQINREVEKRKDKRPRPRDLKDAGGFEEIADNIFMLYRPAYYKKAETSIGDILEQTDINREDELEIIIAKQRQGSMNIKVVYPFCPVTTEIREEEETVKHVERKE